MENGIIASSPTQYSQIAKMMKETPAPQKSPIMMESFHEYLDPPHSRANKNIIEKETNITNPMRSNFGMMLRSVVLLPFCLCALFGTLIKMRLIAATAPMGKFI